MLRRRPQAGAYSAPAWPAEGPPTAWWPALADKTPAVGTPTVSGLELAASDANGEIDPILGLNWGHHQARHCMLSDGSMYICYHRTRVDGTVEVVVRHRSAGGVWAEVGAHSTADDVFLLADQATQTALLVHVERSAGGTVREMVVVSYPGAVRTVVPGDWAAQYDRHFSGGLKSGRYWAAGIGADGMLAIKISVDAGLVGVEGTDATTNSLICGKREAGTWVWTPQRVEQVGIRRGYDFLFPGVNGSRLKVVGLGAWNPHREDYPLPLDAEGEAYLFSGASSYDWSALPGSAYAHRIVMPPAPKGSTPNENPVERMNDALVSHTDGRIYLSYYVFNSGDKGDGWWLMVLDASGINVLADVYLSAPGYFPTYNRAQLLQDGAGKVYILQFSEGANAGQLRVFPVAEESANTFTIPTFAATPDLGPALFGTLRPYCIQMPRLNGGNRLPGNWVRLLFGAAEDVYPAAGERWPSDPGYGRNIGRLYLADLQFPQPAPPLALNSLPITFNAQAMRLAA